MVGVGTIKGFLDGLRPEPRLTVSEWADRYRYLSSKAAAEPGLYRTARTPYIREIADELSVTSIVREIIVMKGAQVGLTELLNNFVGYIIDNAPGPILAVQPTDTMVERNSKMRIAPMIEASPRLREKIKPNRAKDSGNTLRQKEFPGGVLIMTGANSAVGLRSMPARFILADETDGYPLDVDGEGSPMALMEKRASTFSNRKILKISTPTISGQSIIEFEFLKTDQRYYFVPCPHCGGAQILQFKNLRWEPGKYLETKMQCEHCGELIEERFKPEMLKNGVWTPTAPGNADPFVKGYHLSALYSPLGWKSWGEIAKEWDEAQGDENKLKTFYNTVLGETYKEKTEAPEWERIYERAEDYPINKPFKEVALITAGADVQGDRIEVEIVGWFPGRKSQQIDYRVLLGDTTKGEVWEQLSQIVNETWVREDGAVLPLRMLAIDTGYNTATVHTWARKHGFNRVVPIKGREQLDTYFATPKSIDFVKHGKKIGKSKVWAVGVSYIKSEVYGFLRQTIDPETGTVPEGYCYFPKREPHYFRGLTAEVIQAQRDKKRGYVKYVWVKKYERNEPLDCRVYARAAAAILGVDRWNAERWNREGQLATALTPTPSPAATTEPEAPAQQQTTPIQKPKTKRPGSFWSRG